MIGENHCSWSEQVAMKSMPLSHTFMVYNTYSIMGIHHRDTSWKSCRYMDIIEIHEVLRAET
jgi:hypothetical protein